MKQTLYTLIAAIIMTISMSGCRVAPTNGDLDGLWQITAITLNETGEEHQPEQLYYAIYRDLVQLKRGGTIVFTGELVMSDGKLYLNFPYNTSTEGISKLKPWALDSATPTLTVAELNSRYMVLTSGYATIHFRRF